MKKYKFLLIPAVIILLALWASASAVTIFTVPQGGTGVGTVTGILQGNGTSPFSAITVGSGLSFAGGTLSASGGGSPAGATNDIQFNSAGSFGADTGNFTYNSTTGLKARTRYTTLGPAAPNNTVLSGGTSPGMEFWGTDNTSFGVDFTIGNTSNGANAYSALTLNNNLAVSNDFTHFAGMFLNSSTYSDTTFGTAFAVPNLTIIQNTDASIAYAATQNTGAHIFYIGNTNVGGFATVSTANEFARMNITGLGIHTTNPLVGLEVAETSTAAVRGILTGQYSTGTTSSRIITRKARGSLTSPTTVVTGDNLGALVFEGYDGTNYLQMGNIITQAEGTIGTNRVPTNMRFQTATDAATSVLTTALTINSAQLVTLGTTGSLLGRLAFAGNTSGLVTMQGAAAAGTWTMTLPTSGGSSGQFLQTNGSGVTTWAAPSGMSIGGVITSATAGSMLFADASGNLGQDNANIFFNDTLNRLGVGTNDPSSMFDMAGGIVSGGEGDTLEVNGYLDSPWFAFGQYQNFLLRTESIDNATWTKVNVTATASGADDPQDGGTAETISAGGASTDGVSQQITNSTTGNWTCSAWLGTQSGTGTMGLQINSNAQTGTIKTISLTTAWKRYSVTENLSTAHANMTFKITNGTLAIKAWGTQCEQTSTMRPYSGARTTTALTALTSDIRFTKDVTMLGNLAITGSLTGVTNLTIGANNAYIWSGKSRMESSADGLIEIMNNAGTGFTRLNFGGTTSSFPALTRTSATLEAKLADNSAYTQFISKGTATNDNATAGNLGEYVSSLVASGSAVSLTTATTANVTSISLTAGDWDVSGNVNYIATTATVTGKISGITSTSATMPTDGSEVYSGVQMTLLTATDGSAVTRKRFSLSGTTTVYLVAQTTFSAGTVTAYGAITARRVR